MADSKPIYRKLTGSGRGVMAYTRLWSGPDHLMLVKSWPGGEGYRRFFYADIQAVILRRTAGRLVTNLVLVVLALVTAGPFWMYAENEPGMRIAGAGIGGFWLLAILINSLLGPKCEAYIQTLIQTERIPTIHRLRKARKILGEIQPLILAAQGAPEPVEPSPAT